MGQAHGTTGARDDADPHLGLAQYTLTQCRETHVAGQHELAAAAPATAGDLGDGDHGGGAQAVEQGVYHAQLFRSRRRRRGQRGNDVQVRVGDEEVRVGALQDDHLDGAVRLQLIQGGVQVGEHRHIHQVQLAIIQGQEGHPPFALAPQRGVVVFAHDWSSPR